MHRSLTFLFAVLLQFQLRSTLGDVYLGAIVTFPAGSAFKPDIFSFAAFCHIYLP
jgi:hypothetical protein